MDWLRSLESEARQFSTRVGGNDILDGCSLFAVVAIRRGLLSESDALCRAPAYEQPPDLFTYTGAKCTSFTGPLHIALEIARSSKRELTIDDLWSGLRQHNESQFRRLCDQFNIANIA